MNRILAVVKYAFLLAGLAALAGGVWQYLHTAGFVEEAAEAPGRVVGLETSASEGALYYHPVVEFETAAGARARFVSSTGSNPPSYREGQAVSVLYPRDAPEKAQIRSFWSLWFGAVASAGMGMVFVAVWLVLVAVLGAGARHRDLVQTGVPVEAVFVGVEHNRNITVNRRHPLVVVMRWTDPESGRSYTFRSENLWEDPAGRLEPSAVRVFIQRGNPRRYYVDLSRALAR